MSYFDGLSAEVAQPDCQQTRSMHSPLTGTPGSSNSHCHTKSPQSRPQTLRRQSTLELLKNGPTDLYLDCLQNPSSINKTAPLNRAVTTVKTNEQDIVHLHERLSNQACEDAVSIFKETAISDQKLCLGSESVSQVTPSQLADLLSRQEPSSILILDLRSYVSFQQRRVKDAINVCIPTTLLKRPSFSIAKIIASVPDSARARLLRWTDMNSIILYDADSCTLNETSPIGQTAKKFCCTGWQGSVYCVKGGFATILRDCNKLVDHYPKTYELAPKTKGRPTLSLRDIGAFTATPSGKQSAANPFFTNIRQNMDLIGGVGEPIALQAPRVPKEVKELLPVWLRRIAYEPGGSQLVADKFLHIEQEEQRRLQSILNPSCAFDNTANGRYSIAAGVERGDKNRYNNIWPYESSRVKLQHDEKNACDYINASYLHAKKSERTYIATQGPLPATTKDFWQVAWENDARVIVMLTKTEEGGQPKCHDYWNDDRLIQPFKLELVHESKLAGDYDDKANPVTVRKFILSHTKKPLMPVREITHIQFVDWPDFHVIEPSSILSLVQEAHRAELSSTTPTIKRRKSVNESYFVQNNTDRPLITHCSAGCGRTGVFCTIDTVTDILKSQMEDSGLVLDDEDLVEQTVRDFRDQRLSMVQTLRQYVLCYDAVLLYCVQLVEEKLNLGRGAS